MRKTKTNHQPSRNSQINHHHHHSLTHSYSIAVELPKYTIKSIEKTLFCSLFCIISKFNIITIIITYYIIFGSISMYNMLNGARNMWI